MRHHVLRLLGELSGTGKPLSEAEIVSWANKKVASLPEDEGRGMKMKDFRDKSLANGVFLLKLLKAIEPRIINPDLVTDGKTRTYTLLTLRLIIPSLQTSFLSVVGSGGC